MRSRTASGSTAETRPEYLTSQRATMRRTPRNLLSLSDRLFSAGAFDARAADGGFFAVVEVGRPDEERRVAPADPHSLAPLVLRATPDADERILPALAADRGFVRVARQDTHRVGQLEQDLH